ncbi:N-alpha-acetyltransferase, non-catalitic subunit [Rhizina undulata]
MGPSDDSGLADGLEELRLEEKIPTVNPDPPSLPIYAFRDVTKEFFEVSAKLQTGQLIKDPYFGLLEAVGALEIMDPKMDSGMIEPEYESFDCLQPKLPEEIIGIVDRLLSQELAWHSGAALCQTILTNLYVDRLLSSSPTRLEEATFTGYYHGSEIAAEGSHERALLENYLRPYCLALIKCCNLTIQQIHSENTYEASHYEEDFVTQTYNISLLEEVDAAKVVELLNSAVIWLEESKSMFSEDIYKALSSRLLLRRAFLLGISRDIWSWKDRSTMEWDLCLQHLPEVKETHKLGKPVPKAFSWTVQRKLESQVPPRPMVDITFEEAMQHLESLLNDSKEILRVLDYQGPASLIKLFQCLMLRRSGPLPYVRSLLQSLFFKEMKILGSMSIKQLIIDDVKELCHPIYVLFDPQNEKVEAPHDPRFEITKKVDWFVERAGRSYIDFYRNICQNKSRLRRNLCRAILDWDSFQVEAEEMDVELQSFTNEEGLSTPDGPIYSFPLSSWVYHHKLQQMEYVVLLGFELEIYKEHEFAGMYWYLQNYLQIRLGHLERIRRFAMGVKNGGRDSVMDVEHQTSSSMQGNDSAMEVEYQNSSSIRGRDPVLEVEYQKSLSMQNYLLLEASAYQALSGALSNLYTVLGRLDLLKKPMQPYGTDALRYDLRMKPFLTIGCPEVVPFEDFANIVDNPDVEASSLELLNAASDFTMEARKDLDRLSRLDPKTSRTVLCEEAHKTNLRDILRSCVGLGIAIAVLTKAVVAGTTSKEELEVEIDRETFHPFFLVPKITLKKKDVVVNS